jgi:2,4-dienoyl-CoA reductase (NADPH2)
VAPSKLKAPINPFTPRALSARGVERQIADYARAARWPAKPATTASK